MSARDIPNNEWPAYLDDFSREHRAWLATVERVSTGSIDYAEAVDRPLAAVVPYYADRRVARIEIQFQPDSHYAEPIRVDAPTRVRVDETADGVAQGLEIVDDEGGRTRIRFRAAPLPEMLDGVAPEEVA
jgi:hypothetical protein